MTSPNERPVLVTTKHRGVFFGYAANIEGDVIVLRKARNCIQWRDTRGFIGLAVDGPNDACRIGPAAEELQLRDITSVTSVSPEAAKKWESAPWRR